MDKNFLHKINLEALKKDTNLTLEDIAKLSGIKDPKNLGKRSQDKDKGGARPNYNAICRLIEKGATTKTMFGVSAQIGDAEFREGMARANDPEFNAKVEKIVLEMKAKGQL